MSDPTSSSSEVHNNTVNTSQNEDKPIQVTENKSDGDANHSNDMLTPSTPATVVVSKEDPSSTVATVVDLEQNQQIANNDHKPQDPTENDNEDDEYLNHKQKNCCQKTWDVTKSVIPILDWLPKYSLDKFRYDVIAGLTVGIMAIPQGMAYALLAGLPPIYGLYGCIMPAFTYGLLGTSRCAHIGPFALVSMLVYSSVSPFITPEEDINKYISAVMCLSFMVGALLTLLGICQLGIITSLLSETVITAFTSSSAFNIGGSQLKHYLDATVNSSNFLGIMIELFSSENIAKFNYCQLILGISATVLLYIMKELNKRYLKKVPLPNELFLVIIFILISWGFDLKGKYNIKILGDQEIPAGFPSFTVPSFEFFTNLIPGTIIVAVVAFVITFSLGKIFARKDNYKINSNQEMLALGISNIFGSFLSAYPAAGSLSRTALVYNLKSKTQFHNFISPLIIIFCLYCLTDLIKYLPRSTLAAVVEINLINLFKQLGEVVTCWKIDICDFLSFFLCCIINITMGTTNGLITGVSVSLICLVIKLLYVKYKKISEEPLEIVIVDTKKYIEYKVNFTFMFLNRDFIESKLEQEMTKHSKKIILVNMENVKYIDISGFMTIETLIKNYKNIYFAINNQEVNNHMKAYGLIKDPKPEEEKTEEEKKEVPKEPRIFKTMKDLYAHVEKNHYPEVITA